MTDFTFIILEFLSTKLRSMLIKYLFYALIILVIVSYLACSNESQKNNSKNDSKKNEPANFKHEFPMMLLNDRIVTDSFGLINDSNMTSFTQCGTIAEDAKYIEADEFFPFFGSVAIIQKGKSYALINDTGGIVQPFNEYSKFFPQKFYNEECGNLGEFSSMAKAVKVITGYHNQTGEIHILNTYGAFAFASIENKMIEDKSTYPRWNEHGYACFGTISNAFLRNQYKDYQTVLVRFDGKIIPTDRFQIDGSDENENLSSCNSNFNCGLTKFKIGDKFGFVNPKDEIIIPAKFDQVGEFSEGLCPVAILDEFRKEKWGYIDTTGEVVINLQYSMPPGRFCCGRAIVIPIDVSGVKCAYINRKGQTLFYLHNSSADSAIEFIGPIYSYFNSASKFPLNDPSLFSNGFKLISLTKKLKAKSTNYTSDYILDTNGVFIPTFDILRKKIESLNRQKNFSQGYPNFLIISNIYNKQLIYDYNGADFNGVGICDVYGRITMLPIFSDLNLFEPESKLQYAERIDPSTKAYIKGYIDRKGIFRIVQKQFSGF